MLVGAGLACIVHGVFPGFCTKTASRTVDELKRLFRRAPRLSFRAGEAVIGRADPGRPRGADDPGMGNAPDGAGISSAGADRAFALAIPSVYLWTNPQLEPVD